MLKGVFDVMTKPATRNEWRWRAVRRITRLLMPDYRLSWPNLLWWQDRKFNEFLARFGELDGHNSDRRWMLYQLALMSRDMEGDTAECGAYFGAGSYLICKATQPKEGRTHFIFDSFEGVSNPDEHDGDYWKKGEMRCPLDKFQRPEGNISIHKGWIPERFTEVADRRFSFVHIDVDLHQPTSDSINFFYPRMVPGGLMVLDDYGFTSCPGAKKAADDFLRDKTESVVMLSCGSGLLIKSPLLTNTAHGLPIS
jgi:hypothetical protein